MLESISPYTLLCASKPKPPSTVVTAYDLYSAIQHTPAPQEESPAYPLYTAREPENASSMPPSAQQRTHYISDIHKRHANASRRTVLHHNPL